MKLVLRDKRKFNYVVLGLIALTIIAYSLQILG